MSGEEKSKQPVSLASSSASINSQFPSAIKPGSDGLRPVEPRIAIVKELGSMWMQCPYDGQSTEAYYKLLIQMLSGMEYYSHEVELFCKKLGNGYSYLLDSIDVSNKAGMFLSALINNCRDSEVSLDLTGFSRKPPNYIGYNNKDRIIHVKGTLGLYTGDQMCSGKLMVSEGNIRGFSTEIYGGIIIANGVQMYPKK